MLRIAVVALPALACIAGIFLLSADSASAQTAPAQTSSAQYQVYPLRYQQAAEVEKTLAQMLAGFGNQTHLVIDKRTNQILLRGPQQAQDIAKKLVESIDRPPPVAQPPAGKTAMQPPQAQPVKTTVTTYSCPVERLDAVAQELRKQYAGLDNVRIATDRTTSQLFILAPETIHPRIARSLQTMGLVPKIPREQSPTPLPAVTQPAAREQFVPLVNCRIEQVEPRLLSLLGNRLRPIAAAPARPTTPAQANQPGQGNIVGYTFVDTIGQSVELAIDRRRNGVMLSGAPPLIAQMVRLLKYFDVGAPTPEQTVRVIPIRRTNSAKVRQAVEAYRSERIQPKLRPVMPAQPATPVQPPRPIEKKTSPKSNSQSRIESFPHSRPNSRFNDAGVHLANYEMAVAMLQEGGGAAGGGAAGGGAAGGGAAGGGATGGGVAAPGGVGGDSSVDSLRSQQAGDDQRDQNLRELGTEVDVEILPDLDVIILRGRERDVREMSRIIEEIERLSAEAEPVIEVLPLAHVSSDAMEQIIKEVSEDLIDGTQGRVSVTSLEKPNALLLIGWGRAMQSITKLVAQLDKPVAPETQFRVFRLKHASAVRAMSTVGQFYQKRAGLGPEALVVPDLRTNSLVVQASPRDMAEVAKLIADIDSPSSDAVSRARIFKLANSLAADLGGTLRAAIDAAQSGSGAVGGKSTVLEILAVDSAGQRLLKSGILSDVQIVPDIRTNSLVVTAPAESMELIGALIKQLDSPAATAQIKVFEVQNGDANELVRTLRALLPAQPIGTASRPQLPVSKNEDSLAPVRFSVDTRTNCIIATGSTGDLKIIEALLLRLDGRDVQQRKNTVYRLRNTPAVDVAIAVNEFLRSERQVRLAAPGTSSPFQQIEREVIVVPEKLSNSLIISATPRFYDEIMKVVEDLDAEPPQVMIQVVIAEVLLSNAEEFGVELGLQDSLLFDRSLLSNLLTITKTTEQQQSGSVATQTTDEIISADNTPGFNFVSGDPLGNSGSKKSFDSSHLVGGQGITTFAVGRMNDQLGFGGLVLSASSESVSVLIRALEACGRLNVVARPQVMTLDNQPAFVQVGKNVPRIAGSELTAYGQVNTVAMENIGLIMGVTPRISPENMVVMELDVEKSDIGPESEWIPVFVSEGQAVKSPSFNITKATTTVSAINGETIVLGGLIAQSIETNRKRVPWLSDIPVLGHFFRYDSELKKRAELLIILTPRVVRGPADIEKIKQAEAARMHWCLGDVVEIHGDIGVYDVRDEMSHGGRPDVIYPDMNPRGIVPDAMIPTHKGDEIGLPDTARPDKSQAGRQNIDAEQILTPPPMPGDVGPGQTQGSETQQFQPQPGPKAPRADGPALNRNPNSNPNSNPNNSGVQRVPVTLPPVNASQPAGGVQRAANIQPTSYSAGSSVQHPMAQQGSYVPRQ